MLITVSLSRMKTSRIYLTLVAAVCCLFLLYPRLGAAQDSFSSVQLSGNGEVLSCQRGGSGSPVLLLHGRPNTSDAWTPLLGPTRA